MCPCPQEVFKQTLSLSAISFGQFTEPEGPLETGPVTVIKGTAGGFSTDANFCAQHACDGSCPDVSPLQLPRSLFFGR